MISAWWFDDQQWPQAGFNNFTMAMAQAAQAQQAQENMMRLQQVRIIMTIYYNSFHDCDDEDDFL